MREPVHQPALGHGLHPGAAEGDDLTADKVAVVPVPQGAEAVRQTACRRIG
jgi:hypothetical protein